MHDKRENIDGFFLRDEHHDTVPIGIWLYDWDSRSWDQLLKTVESFLAISFPSTCFFLRDEHHDSLLIDLWPRLRLSMFRPTLENCWNFLGMSRPRFLLVVPSFFRGWTSQHCPKWYLTDIKNKIETLDVETLDVEINCWKLFRLSWDQDFYWKPLLFSMEWASWHLTKSITKIEWE